ncbi:MAG: ribose 5-phosphate isomerase B [Planctomycetota bacterium]|nr:ribose 5-phosphate isomerase B [Planctomycetota bacterium]
MGGVIAIGADHGGFALKERLIGFLKQKNRFQVLDHGAYSKDSVDYPDLAAAVAKSVALGEAAFGILVDGAGIGSCMAANKFPGVLAANCHSEATARNSREHNGANVLCLGSGHLDTNAATAVLDAWLSTAFGGGRHGRRVAKIKAIEKNFMHLGGQA